MATHMYVLYKFSYSEVSNCGSNSSSVPNIKTLRGTEVQPPGHGP